MKSDFEQVFETAWRWCRARSFAGYDPFDALNSRLFQLTPFRRSRFARIAWTQTFKRSPVNLRSLARVPAEKNAKGTALFALAALSRFRARQSKEDEREARRLLDDLLAARLSHWSGAAWGYNFDWQSRAFFAPRGTPTVVPTAFAARAFVEAAQAFGDERYIEIARSVCEFILRDLRRSEDAASGEICFSYTPLDSSCVYNASLLAAETLASVGALTGERDLCDWAARAGRYVLRRQRADGSWLYGAAANQAWVDNFHTAFVLASLARIMQICETDRDTWVRSLRRGYDFWRTHFFLADGWPKYYDNKLYPADAHSAASAIIAFLELQHIDKDALRHAERIVLWTVQNLFNERGFFYYQRRRFYTVRTPYMRWAQAWMIYALARLIERMKDEGRQTT